MPEPANRFGVTGSNVISTRALTEQDVNDIWAEIGPAIDAWEAAGRPDPSQPRGSGA